MADSKVAVYWDFENLHGTLLGEKHGADTRYYLRMRQDPLVQIPAVMEYVMSIGDIVSNRAYANWQSYSAYRDQLLTYAIDLIQLYPRAGAKNGADIRLALDALEDASTHAHITHAVILGGDSDYISVAQKLKRLGKLVIGVGMKGSTNAYWVRSCSEFKFYETLLASAAVEEIRATDESGVQEPAVKTFEAAKDTLVRAIRLLMEEDEDGKVLKARVRPMMTRLDSGFDPRNYGFSTFNAFLEACSDVIAATRGDKDKIISLKQSPQVGLTPPSHPAIAPPEAAPARDTTEKAIALLAWAVSANLGRDKPSATLPELGTTMRQLDSGYPAAYAISKNGGLKKLVQVASDRELMTLAGDVVTPSPGFESFLQRLEPPAQFDNVRRKRLLAAAGIDAAVSDVEKAAIVFAESVGGQPTAPVEDVMQATLARLAAEGGHPTRWQRALSNALTDVPTDAAGTQDARQVADSYVNRAVSYLASRGENVSAEDVRQILAMTS